MISDKIDLKEPEGMIFTEFWCSDREKKAIAKGVELSKDLEGDNIEIGCFEGRSTVFTANLLYPEILIAIDPWVPIKSGNAEVKIYAERPIREHFDNNIKLGTNGNVDVKAMRWEDFFESYEGKIKYLYLDGPHTYDNVYKSLEVLTPFFVEGGVMVGDDYDDKQVRRAVEKFFGEDLTHPDCSRSFMWVNK